MNLIQQFPDISMEIRNKLKLNRKAQPGLPLKTPPIVETDTMLDANFDNEFRRWHYKLAFIILLCVCALYAVVLTMSILLSGG